MPFTVGLTGGIGSGKSTVSDLFAALGAEIIDTDEIARALTASGQPAVSKIAQEFGPEVVGGDGALDRGRMRELAFSDTNVRERLQNILHPLIRAEVQRRLAATDAPYAIVVVPLLVESRGYKFANRILVVDCSEEQQVERVTRRNGLARSQVEAIMATQVSRNERLAAADDVIRNEGDVAELHAKVKELHQKYLALAL
ncbi:MAG: dephospho-CoA kinase [Betaproteobacteria bacterium SG8_40]|nr:MAG: dephospho-CoA kinase [Betaproteobacteria bacterium SG8_40]